jgi:DNA modification methylase
MGPLLDGERWRVDVGDCRAWLRSLPAGYAHACVSSPPYWGLRDYGVDGQIGLEKSPAEYVAEMVGVFREVRRVLRDDGTLWLNLGDSYARMQEGNVPQSKNPGCTPPVMRGRLRNAGLKAKDLVGIPWMVAFALRDDGWYLRSDCIWFKRNVMPESVRDRPNKSHEHVFMLTKTGRPYFDMEAVKERAAQPLGERKLTGQKKRAALQGLGASRLGSNQGPQTRHLRTVWDIPTAPHKVAHFAVMAPKVVLRCVLASTSEEGVCPACGAPWRRAVERNRKATRPGVNVKYLPHSDGDRQTAETNGWNRPNVIGNRDPRRHVSETRMLGWRPGCDCPGNAAAPAVVIDPFGGAGTTPFVAVKYGRRGHCCELNPAYAELARRRVGGLGVSLFDVGRN